MQIRWENSQFTPTIKFVFAAGSATRLETKTVGWIESLFAINTCCAQNQIYNLHIEVDDEHFFSPRWCVQTWDNMNTCINSTLYSAQNSIWFSRTFVDDDDMNTFIASMHIADIPTHANASYSYINLWALLLLKKWKCCVAHIKPIQLS